VHPTRRILLVATVLVGVVTTGAAHAAHAATPVCSVTGSTVGQPLVLTASGLRPNTYYAVNWIWPDGSQADAPTSTDASGALTSQETAYFSGTTTVQVVDEHGNRAVQCSASITVA